MLVRDCRVLLAVAEYVLVSDDGADANLSPCLRMARGYAANRGIARSTNRKNRWLRSPATTPCRDLKLSDTPLYDQRSLDFEGPKATHLCDGWRGAVAARLSAKLDHPAACERRRGCQPRRLHCLAALTGNHRCGTEGGWRCCRIYRVSDLNRRNLDGKCWLERQKGLRNGADTAQAEYQLRADSNLLDEIQKRSDLRRREVARGMIGIERIEFFRPFRQDLNKLASRQ
jgi:hypothetical protein